MDLEGVSQIRRVKSGRRRHLGGDWSQGPGRDHAEGVRRGSARSQERPATDWAAEAMPRAVTEGTR